MWYLGQNLDKIVFNIVKKFKKKKKRIWHFSMVFSYFTWGMHLKARSSGYRNTWVEIEGQVSWKSHIWSFAHFVSKIAKSDYLRDFCFIQSLICILGNNIAFVFLRDWKLKFCSRNSIFGPFGAKMWVQVRSKMTKRLFSCQPLHSQPSFPKKQSS